VNKRIVIRGGGDLATGTIYCLHQCGYQVLVLEIEKPTAIRRSVAFSDAMYNGEATVEGVTARKIDSVDEAQACWLDGVIPIIQDETAACVSQVKPFAFIDAAIAKVNLGTTIDMAPLVIGLGPGFTAGVDTDLVIETKRGHRLGRIISEGCAIPNTGIPGIIGGYGRERVIHSENEGVFRGVSVIGDIVKKGDLIAYVGEKPVYASIDGVLRGILKDGLYVPVHFKIADIDPRLSERENCFTISDKARAIAGGVLQAVCMYEHQIYSKGE
jgi:xanthine dehydrogenase accessory factor